MTDLIERVARAIWDARETHQHPRCQQTWDQGSGLAKRITVHKAIAAIKAMREPTEDMLQSCSAMHSDKYVGIGMGVEAWKNMIDAALGENK